MGPPHLERGAGRAFGGSRRFCIIFDYQLPAVRHVVAPSLGLEAPQRRNDRLPAPEGEVQEQWLAPSLGPEAPQRCNDGFPAPEGEVQEQVVVALSLELETPQRCNARFPRWD